MFRFLVYNLRPQIVSETFGPVVDLKSVDPVVSLLWGSLTGGGGG